MRQIIIYFKLLRAHNCFIALLAVAVGQYLTAGFLSDQLNHFAMAAAFFVCAFGNLVNDIRDVESDRINHPQRALPTGAVTIERARTLSFFLLIISLVLTFWLSWPGRIIVVAGLIVVTLYNLYLKRLPYWGNLSVSILSGFTFILGGTETIAASGAGLAGLISFPGSAIPAIFAVLMHFGREIIKDVADIGGDVIDNSRTAPIKHGKAIPLGVAYLLFLFLIIFSIAVYLIGWFGPIYLYITLSLISLPLVAQMVLLGFSPDSKRCLLVSTIVKFQMIPGIIALILGKNF